LSEPSRAVITLATTKPVYVDMAFALARSFKVWHRDKGIPFHIITDLAFELPADLADIGLIRVEPGRLGSGFSPKLHLDKLAPADRTLFLDADCLCVGSIDDLFDRFAGRAVGVIGSMKTTGKWFGDIEAILKRIGRAAMPQFNGGVYYLERGALASRIYERAREIEPLYDEWGLVRLRGRPNDEVLVAIALAEVGIEPINDDGTLMAPFNAYPVVHELNVFAGRCVLENPAPPHPMHRPDTQIATLHPRLPHFVAYFTDQHHYRAEVSKLRLVSQSHLPVWLAEAWVTLTVRLPGIAIDAAKTRFRPIYRRLFGVRRIKESVRV
jgi:hypothetical protein